MPGFQWILELIDKTSKPAKQAEEAVGGFEKELKKVEAQIARVKANPLEFKKLQDGRKELRELTAGSTSFAQKFEEMGAAVKKTAFVQNLMLGVEAFHLVTEAAEKVIDVVVDVGKEMLGAAGGAERFQKSFTSLLGAEEAEGVISYIESIEKHTELSGAELKALSADFLTVGFSAKELAQVLPAALDVGAFRGGGLASIQAAAAGLEHIKTTGEISKKSLGSMGLVWSNVMAELRKETGLTDKELKAKMDGGKFGDQILHGVLQSIADKQPAKKLGAAAEDMATSMDSKLKKLRELPEKLFEKWASTPGFAKFSAALSKILDKLDPDGPNGKKLFSALDSASMKVVQLVEQFANGDGIDKFVGGVQWAAGEVDKIPAILDKVVSVSEVIATIWGGSKIVSGITSLTAALPALGTAAGATTAATAGIAGALGLMAVSAGSVAFAIYRIVDAVEKLGGLKAVWDDFKEFTTGKGPAISGPDKTEDKFDKARRVLDMFGSKSDLKEVDQTETYDRNTLPSQSTRVREGAGIASLHQNSTVHLTIHAPNGNADEIAHSVNQSLPGAMQQAHEKMAVSSGVL